MSKRLKLTLSKKRRYANIAEPAVSISVLFMCCKESDLGIKLRVVPVFLSTPLSNRLNFMPLARRFTILLLSMGNLSNTSSTIVIFQVSALGNHLLLLLLFCGIGELQSVKSSLNPHAIITEKRKKEGKRRSLQDGPGSSEAKEYGRVRKLAV